MKWADLLPEVLVHVPGCPEMLAEDMIKAAAIRFCRDSHVWEERLQSIYPIAGSDLYQLTLPDESELLSLSYARQAKEGAEHYAELHPTVNVFGLLHFEDGIDVDKGSVAIRAVLQPARASTGMPDRLGLHYDRALFHGALGRLFEIPRKDWSAPEMAAYHWNEHRKQVVEARVRRSKGNTERPLRVKPQAFI